jgi:hypothetical protein
VCDVVHSVIHDSRVFNVVSESVLPGRCPLLEVTNRLAMAIAEVSGPMKFRASV